MENLGEGRSSSSSSCCCCYHGKTKSTPRFGLGWEFDKKLTLFLHKIYILENEAFWTNLESMENVILRFFPRLKQTMAMVNITH
jgi:hypothetical protein